MKLILFYLIAALGVVISSSAYAYIGPGAAVAFLGYAFGPVIAIVVSVGLIFAWLGRLIWKKVKGRNTDVQSNDKLVSDVDARDEE